MGAKYNDRRGPKEVTRKDQGSKDNPEGCEGQMARVQRDQNPQLADEGKRAGKRVMALGQQNQQEESHLGFCLYQEKCQQTHNQETAPRYKAVSLIYPLEITPSAQENVA